MKTKVWAMGEKKICLRCWSEYKSNHECKSKSLAVLLVDEDRSNDDVILIVSDEEQEKRAVDLVISNMMMAQNCKSVDYVEKSASFNEVIS